jgi:tetratricopeptide (TPR) repeat protein
VAAPLDPETTPEEYRQRALLLADLGRYDEAAGEIAAGLTSAPDEPTLLDTLARIHLVAEQPAEALVAAERAVTAAPSTLTTLVVRAMALADSRRFAEAAQVAGDILRQWPADAYAQRTGAALLSESRNGQEALNAAWNGVRVAPAEAEAHLVLAVVAARLRLFDLAQRAYAEALELEPGIADAQRDMGIVRFERRRWARALEELADGATLSAPVADEPPPAAEESSRAAEESSRAEEEKPYPSPFPRPYPAPDRPDQTESPAHSSTGWTEQPAVSRPSGPVIEPAAESAQTVRHSVLVGANITLIAGLLAGLMTLSSAGISRMWGGLIGVLIFVGITVMLNRGLTEPLAAALTRLRAKDRPTAVATYLIFAAPLFLLVYALIGGIVPLIAALVLAAVAELLILTRR